MGEHYGSYFFSCFLHHRLSVPFATIYFNPMNNCSNKYEIHLYSFSSSLESSSFFFPRFELQIQSHIRDLDETKQLLDGLSKCGGKRNSRIIKCNNRWMQFSIFLLVWVRSFRDETFYSAKKWNNFSQLNIFSGQFTVWFNLQYFGVWFWQLCFLSFLFL